MRLPFLRPKTEAQPTAAPRGGGPQGSLGDVEQARTRARRRLMGASVLLALGVLSFPLVFDNTPRPLPRDIPIELPAGAGPAPAVAPRPGRPLPVLSVPADAGNEAQGVVAPIAASVPRAVSAPASAAASVPALPPAPDRMQTSAPVRTDAPATVPPASAQGSKASAPAPVAPPAAAASAAARYVVQVGAYTDGPTLRATRERVEKLGLKTYTQVIETSAGKRTRVRLGPFASRAEADVAVAKLKRAGLPANVLAL